jgi:SAM-dependent methyltransferase
MMIEIFESLPRQGPGDRASTARALAMVEGLPEDPEILDIGCGSGRQTLDLATLTAGRITAVDNHPPFLATLRQAAAASGFADRIRTVAADMAALDFPAASFDLIWSEGAAYIMGFAEALRAWRPLLRPRGSLVVSEIAWFRPDPPAELREFFAAECPDMMHHEDLPPLIAAAGYELTGAFSLPDASWWTDYYEPLAARIAALRERGGYDDAAAGFLDALELEIELHRRYAAYYGYRFFVMRRGMASGSGN